MIIKTKNMNMLYVNTFPIIISNCNGTIPMSVVWAILIVVNVIWFLSFIVAKIHNMIINAKRVCFKDKLGDREYFFFISLISIVIDIIASFCLTVYWVSTLI